MYKSPTKNFSSLFVISKVFFSGCAHDVTSYLAIGKKWKWHVELEFCLRWIPTVRQTGPRSSRVYSPYRRLTALSVDNSLVLLFVLSLLSWHSMAPGTLWASIGKRKARARHGMCRRSAVPPCFVADEFSSFPFAELPCASDSIFPALLRIADIL